jgi:hypothetical protein
LIGVERAVKPHFDSKPLYFQFLAKIFIQTNETPFAPKVTKGFSAPGRWGCHLQFQVEDCWKSEFVQAALNKGFSRGVVDITLFEGPAGRAKRELLQCRVNRAF